MLIHRVLVLCVAVGVTGCKISTSTPNGAGGSAQDGGKKDVATSSVPGTSDAATQPKTPSQSKGKTESCSCDRECQSGFCVDGICCTSACADTCKACNLPSSLGDCAFVPAGVKPTDPQDCAATKPATCGQDGTCDGKGGCRQYPKGTECKAGTCEGDGVAGILACDGKGSCSDATSQTCPPYTCDPATNLCAATCTTDAQCAAGRQCVAHRCGKSANGAACQSPDDCSSGFCTDGVCCNVACSGACVSCNQTGSLGHCTFVPAGISDPACHASERTTCGNTGLCDGLGSCTLYPEQTVCGSSACSDLVESAPRTCDGRGTCREAQLVDCSPFLCASGACVQDCKSDADCETGHQCVLQTRNGVTTGSCGKRKNGQPCPDPSECVSGQCVDGVCCESSCTGPCRSCNMPGSPGQCLNAASGAHDPRNTCTDLGAALCSTNGVCDGNGACQSYPAGTECNPQACVNGAYSPPSTCNVSAQCVASPSRTCSPFLCNGNTCYDTCVSDKQCVTGHFCENSSCGLKPRGANCSLAQDCLSGFCAQGVCCDSACTGACMACNLTAAAGTCTTVADKAPDPQGICVVTQSNTCGTTGACAKGACTYYDKGFNCKAAVCAGTSSVTPVSTCDGKGACTTPGNQSCGGFVCDSGACKTTCTKDTDCVAPDTCVNNSCGLKVNGAACTTASQCQSGFCTEGVCCNSACADAASGGLCKTCRGTGTSRGGTCSNVDSGGPDPKSRCPRSDVSGGDCSKDGSCNGSGACRPWPPSAGCRQESCVGSTHTLPANCSGNGDCPAATTASCGSYVCSATSPTCLNTCTSNGDCTNNLTCLQTNSRCGDKLAAGATCQADSDCSTGLVCSSEKVCCDHACAGACQSCKVSGRAGTCSNIASSGTPRDTTTCPAAAPGACGDTGKCDGAGACELRSSCTPNITTCPTDPHFQFASIGTCGAGGTCATSTQGCGPGYLCVSGGSCATSCTPANAATNCDTVAGYGCLSGLCQKKPNGSTCTDSSQCSNGHCVDGYCCNTACDALCYACDVSPTPGTCSPVPNNAADATSASGPCLAACQGQTQMSGLCDGAGSCKGVSSCQTGFVCANNACVSTCSGSTGCASGYSCVNGSCLKSNGATCTADGECANGHCLSNGNGTNRVCCAVPCSDSSPCGTKAMCLADGSACQRYPAACAAATCSLDGLSSVSAGTCSGANCVQTTTLCSPGYTCSAGVCASSCSGSSPTCAPGYTCVGTTCLKADGQLCGGPGECVHNTCIADGHGTDKVCCAVACADVACGSKALCATNGSVCQTHTGETCGSSCSTDQRASLGPGTCNGSGGCNQASTNCTTGYLCVAGSCTVPGGCTPTSGCDTANSYVCNTGNCELPLVGDGGVD